MSDVRSTAPTAEGTVRLLRLCGLSSLLLLLVALAGAIRTPTYWPLWLTSRQVFLEDVRLAAALVMASALSIAASRLKLAVPVLTSRMVMGATVGVIVFCYAGHYLVLHGYDLTRDEQLVRFDAWIFEQGRLVWPIPAAWQPDADALTLRFMLPVARPTAWVSAYLPGNALLHALVGRFADMSLTAPLLTGLCLPLLWSCTSKIWPDDRETATVSFMLLAASGQFLLTGMTTYAMASHLFFNLVWLRLFLNDRSASDWLALPVGWFATGLHQPLFHPMFVAPFLLMLVIEHRWRRLALFVAGYLVIGLFWLWYPLFLHGLISGPLSHDVSATDYAGRLREAFSIDQANVALTSANLLRFMTWQNAALIPLIFAARPLIRRDRLAGALALGLMLPLLVLAIILPWQGPGFGYRYLHPVMGNAALLGGYGWRALTPLHGRMRPYFAVASISTLLILLPLQLMMSHARYAANALADATIDASGADYAIIQIGDGLAYGSIVVNRPDLFNRPIRLLAEDIRDPVELARRICRSGTTVAMATNAFYRPGAAYFDVPSPDTADARLSTLRAPYEAAGCRVVLLR